MRRFLSLLAMLLFIGGSAFAQERTVTGKVINNNGTPLQGITVQVRGTNTAAPTDAAGEFTLSVKNNNAVLVLTGVGFQSQEVKVGSQSNLTVVMQTESRTLEQVVVTALGIKRQEKSLGYSTTVVNDQVLTESKPTTVGEGLAGKVAGLQINTINNGVDPSIRIVLRGYRHINADNQALVVVDGVPVRSDFLSTLNPNDISSITVLKGASASALYGADATNGVVVVTTKRGSSTGKPKVEFNNTTMLERVSYMPALQNKFAPGSSETGPYPWDPTHYFTDPYSGQILYVPYENQNYGMEFNGDPNLGYIGGPLQDGSFFKTPFKAINPDPRKAFFQTGYRIQNNLSMSGGDAENSYIISVQDVSTKGTVPKDVGRRTSLYVSGTKTYGRFSATFSLTYSQKYSNEVGPDFNQGRPVYWNLLNQGANVPLNDPRIKDPNSPFFLDNYYNAYYPNPWWQIYNARDIAKTNSFNGVLTLNFKATNWMNLTYRAGTNYATFDNNNYVGSVSFSPYAVSDPWQAGNTASSVGLHKNGSGSYTNGNAKAIQQDAFITFHKEIKDFTGTLIVGNTIAEKPYGNDMSNYTKLSSSELFIDNFYNTDYRLGELTGTEQQSKTRLLSGFGDLTLGYKGFVFAHGSFRRDWTSLLPTGSNAYNFWDVDASFVFTEAISAFKSQDVISYGKIRGTYSKTGQITIGPYNFTNIFDVASGFPYGSTAGLTLDGSFRNPELKPEKTTEKEVGLEMGLLKNRINVDLSYYHDVTSGQTFPVNISNTTGFSSAFVNAGEILSQGFEATVSADIIRNTASGLRWNVGATYSWNGSKVLSMYQDVKQFSIGLNNYAVVGQPFPVLETNDIQRDPATGKVVIDPKNGYPKLVDTNQIVGRSTPSDMLNLTTSVSWKNFSLNAVASYRTGNQFYAFVGQELDFTGASEHTALNNRERFIFPNSVYWDGSKYVDNNQYYIQDGARGFWTVSDYTNAGTTYVLDGSFWKLRSITLSYDFKDLLRNTKFVKQVVLSVIGKNLLMWRPSQNLWTDPEFNESNVNAQSYSTYNQLPPTRQYGVSLDVRF